MEKYCLPALVGTFILLTEKHLQYGATVMTRTAWMGFLAHQHTICSIMHRATLIAFWMALGRMILLWISQLFLHPMNTTEMRRCLVFVVVSQMADVLIVIIWPFLDWIGSALIRQGRRQYYIGTGTLTVGNDARLNLLRLLIIGMTRFLPLK